MRTMGLTLSLALTILSLGLFHGDTQAGERLPSVNSLPVGFRYCPAPGADNSEFNSSYYAVDARTGKMERYSDGHNFNGPAEVDTEEKVLFVAPTIDVENKYVPYPGAAPQQAPSEFANSNHGYNPNNPAQQQPYAQPNYSQPQQDYHPEQYAHNNRRPQQQQQNEKRPWWQKVLR